MGRQIACVFRAGFSGRGEGNFSESWETIEATPDGGGPPIRFGLFWVPVRAGPLNLFGGLDALLPKVRQLLAGKK
jgi:hypothetical protein